MGKIADGFEKHYLKWIKKSICQCKATNLSNGEKLSSMNEN